MLETRERRLGDRGYIPNTFTLGQSFPNPFNPSTQIGYGLPQDGHVELTVFNVVGQKIRYPVNLFGQVAAFYNFYTDLRSLQLQPARTVDDPVPYNVVPLNVSNLAEAQSCGVELEADWQAMLGGTLDLQPELDLDVIGRYVHDLPTLNVDGYFNLDARLA